MASRYKSVPQDDPDHGPQPEETQAADGRSEQIFIVTPQGGYESTRNTDRTEPSSIHQEPGQCTEPSQSRSAVVTGLDQTRQLPEPLPNQHKRWELGVAIATVVFGLALIIIVTVPPAVFCINKETSKSNNYTEFIAQNVTVNTGEFDRDTYNRICFRKGKTDTNTVEVYASTIGDISTYSLHSVSNVLHVYAPFRGDLQAPYLYPYLVTGSALRYTFEIINATGTDVNYTFLLFDDYKKKEAFRETGEGRDGAIYTHNVTSGSPASFNITRTSFYFAMLQAPTQATVEYEYVYTIISYNRSRLGSPVCVLNPSKDHCCYDIDQDLSFFVYTLPQEQEQKSYLYLDIQATKRPPLPSSCYIAIGVSVLFFILCTAGWVLFILGVCYCCKGNT